MRVRVWWQDTRDGEAVQDGRAEVVAGALFGGMSRTRKKVYLGRGRGGRRQGFGSENVWHGERITRMGARVQTSYPLVAFERRGSAARLSGHHAKCELDEFILWLGLAGSVHFVIGVPGDFIRVGGTSSGG